MFIKVTPAFSLEIQHRWGNTVIESVPKRVVSLSFAGIDTALALGITPIAYRAWLSGDQNGLWPWTAAQLPSTSAPVVFRGDIDIEAIARLSPDFVEALSSGITRAQYSALSKVTAVVPPTHESGDFEASWENMLITVGRATHRLSEAEQKIAEIEGRIAGVRTRHPDWIGKTMVVALPAGPIFFSERDPRVKLLKRLGFQLPDAAKQLAHGGFYTRVDRELTAPLDADVVIWLDFGAGLDALNTLKLRPGMRAFREGREVIADRELSAALSYASPLSIPYVLDRIVPMLEAALDGDPATSTSASPPRKAAE